jgi:hypothetical protein
MKASERGTVSIYGMGRFPVTPGSASIILCFTSQRHCVNHATGPPNWRPENSRDRELDDAIGLSAVAGETLADTLADLSGRWIDIVHGRRPPRGIVHRDAPCAGSCCRTRQQVPPTACVPARAEYSNCPVSLVADRAWLRVLQHAPSASRLAGSVRQSFPPATEPGGSMFPCRAIQPFHDSSRA